MKKTYILDTNVLLSDPESIFAFEDNNVIIPLAVLEEIDNHKGRQDSVGFNAREVSRNLDKLKKKGNLKEGIKLKNEGVLYIKTKSPKPIALPEGLNKKKTDNKIIQLGLQLKNFSDKFSNIILVAKDINLRLIAHVCNIKTEDYQKNKIEIDDIKGYEEIYLTDKNYELFAKQKFLKIENTELKGLYPHKFFVLKKSSQPQSRMLARLSKDKTKLLTIRHDNSYPWGIGARNLEQKFALDLLLDPEIKLVTLMGPAGTGKTLLSLAASLHQVEDKEYYNRISVARPVIPVGKDIGFLPGEKDDKLKPWMQPIFDNLEFIFNNSSKEIADSASEYLIGKKIIQLEALSYIRGRSINNHLIIIDEAQNLTRLEAKTIVTRVGKDSKVIFTGDPEQIDIPYLDKKTNGLAYLAKKFKNESIAGHIVLSKGERSELAEIASKIL